jgi:hypothetical protein
VQQQWVDDYAMSDRGMMGALGGEVKRDRPSYNRFDDDEVETVEEARRHRIENSDIDEDPRGHS